MYTDPGLCHHLYKHYLGKTKLTGVVTIPAAGAQLSGMIKQKTVWGLKDTYLLQVPTWKLVDEEILGFFLLGGRIQCTLTTSAKGIALAWGWCFSFKRSCKIPNIFSFAYFQQSYAASSNCRVNWELQMWCLEKHGTEDEQTGHIMSNFITAWDFQHPNKLLVFWLLFLMQHNPALLSILCCSAF